ncbi:unnamed protein product [Malus baccata var. baccata]
MSVLKLSFDNLTPSSLKQCFAYCSMFVKDFEIKKDDLVQLWMAQGYFHSSPNLSMEDIGNEYFNILLQNSLLQDAREDKHDITNCKMHDLVHDLAKKTFKFESLTRDLDQMDDDALEIQHVARISSTTLERIPKGSVTRLRSLFVDYKVPSNIFQKFRALRTLNLFRAEIEELPSSIGKLKRLRYLNISQTEIKELPKSIGKLYNLQTLRMSNTDIKTFPREMENLINLRHVYVDKDEEVPFGMTRLTHLQTLPSFNLDRARRHRLDDLGGLNELKGKLVIGSLKFVRDKEEAKKSKLVEKENLRKLILKWGWVHPEERNGNFLDEDILEGLQPHPNLESLTIEEFKGTKFASWLMRNCRVTNLRQLRIRSCEKLLSLCCGLEYCPSLEMVEIKDCGNLESFQISPSQSLQELWIVGCPKLRCTSIRSLPSLRDLVIERCTTLEGDLSLNGCISLRKLRIEECNGFTSILSGLHSCTSLRTLRIKSCPNLRTLSGHGLQTPVSLERMRIQNCPNLEAIPSLDNLTSLTNLDIWGCDGLISLPSGLAYCTSLTKLEIWYCKNLMYLPTVEAMQRLTKLHKLEIYSCPRLKERCAKDSGPEWPKISHIPDLRRESSKRIAFREEAIPAQQKLGRENSRFQYVQAWVLCCVMSTNTTFGNGDSSKLMKNILVPILGSLLSTMALDDSEGSYQSDDRTFHKQPARLAQDLSYFRQLSVGTITIKDRSSHMTWELRLRIALDIELEPTNYNAFRPRDLSNNNLTGPVPQFLEELAHSLITKASFDSLYRTKV